MSTLPPSSSDTISAWEAGAAPSPPCAPLKGRVDADLVILGGGFTGVSTAWHVSRRFPDRRVVLLERGHLGAGASGRNGGMMLNQINGVETDDPERALRVYQATCEGIDGILSLIRAHAPGVRHRRDGSLEVFTDPRRAEEGARHAEWLRAAGVPVRFLDREALRGRVSLEGVHGALLDPMAGQLHGVDLLRALKPLLLEAGVGIYEQTPALSIEEGAVCRVVTPGGEVHARALVLATNAWTPSLGYFKSGILPLHSHVIATERLPPERWEALGWRGGAGFSDDLDRIAYASLTPDGELLFGGGSNAAYAYLYGGRTAWPGQATAGFEAVRRRLLAYMPGLAGVGIAHRWTGALGVTLSRVCTMGVRGEHQNVYYALGYSGHGVTLANLAGRVLCDLYAGEGERWAELPFLNQRLLPVPPEPLRWLGYQAFTRLTGRSPRRALPF